MRNVSFFTVRRGPIPERWRQQYNGVYRPKLVNETLDYEKAEGKRSGLDLYSEIFTTELKASHDVVYQKPPGERWTSYG